MNVMVVEALRIDPDDVAFELLPEIEASFDIQFGKEELGTLTTIGDLYSLILDKTGESTGAACGTPIVFHALRRALVPFGVDPRAPAGLRLSQASLPAPRLLRKRLTAVTGWRIPTPPITIAGTLIGLLLLFPAPIAILAAGHAWWAPIAPILGILVLRLDRGSWAGDWARLGTLARAIAARNHAALATRGARH